MATITLQEAKDHLRIIGSAEDSMVQLYIGAADDWITNYLNQGIPGLTDSPATVAPNAIKAAALMIVAGLFENREAVGEKEIKHNPAVESLLFPYRVNMGV